MICAHEEVDLPSFPPLFFFLVLQFSKRSGRSMAAERSLQGDVVHLIRMNSIGRLKGPVDIGGTPPLFFDCRRARNVSRSGNADGRVRPTTIPPDPAKDMGSGSLSVSFPSLDSPRTTFRCTCCNPSHPIVSTWDLARTQHHRS